jgi:hypothetical protein
MLEGGRHTIRAGFRRLLLLVPACLIAQVTITSAPSGAIFHCIRHPVIFLQDQEAGGIRLLRDATRDGDRIKRHLNDLDIYTRRICQEVVRFFSSAVMDRRLCKIGEDHCVVTGMVTNLFAILRTPSQ